MKLELKHIAPYLPYGLKMYWEELGSRKPKIPWVLHGKGIDSAIENQDMPILRPLSGLTKEIEVSGEKFVPIIELAKIHDSSIEIKNIENQNGTIVAYCKIDYHPSIEKPLCRTFFEVDLEDLDFDYGFEVFGESENDIIQTEFFPVKNQLYLFQQLFEWHFDIFGLIEAGLAIDINTLQK